MVLELGQQVLFFLLLKTPFGVSDNTGNTAWLKFPGIPVSIGPAEVVKITFVVLLARQLEWLREDGKTVLYDGRTGEPFDNLVTVGYPYYLKLHQRSQ